MRPRRSSHETAIAEHHTNDAFTDWEFEVLRYVAGGKANEIAAAQLNITEETVKAQYAKHPRQARSERSNARCNHRIETRRR
jgi:DNA-binding NarL/FixJ family response regulator